jgi:hypothetical protein
MYEGVGSAAAGTAAAGAVLPFTGVSGLGAILVIGFGLLFLGVLVLRLAHR